MLSEGDLADFAQHLGDVVRERREQLGIPQEQLAHRSGLSQRQVWEMEKGLTSPQLKTWLRLARGLEVPLNELLAGAQLRAGAERAAFAVVEPPSA